MDGFNLFNIGFGELLFILVLAGLVLGPQRIRQIARLLGVWTAKLQNISRQFRNQLNSELDAADREDLKGAMDDIQDLRRQVQELRRELISSPNSLYKQGEKSFNGTGQPTVEKSVAPATLPTLLDVDDDPE
jgi:Tat protein translocase TatB subunit